MAQQKFPKGSRTLLFKSGDSHPCYVANYAASDTGQDTRARDTGTADNWVQGVFIGDQYVSGDVFEVYAKVDTGASKLWEKRGIITKA